MSEGWSVRDFVAELRRRRVVRVVVAYAVVAWAIIEVADTVAPALALPEWTDSFVVLIALIGFPLAVILAWAYEITPDGVRRTEPEVPRERAGSAGAAAGPGASAARMPSARRPTTRRDPPRPAPAERQTLAAPGPDQLRRAMLATLRHELRTPLIAIIGYSEMLLEDAPPARAASPRSILAGGRRVLSLVDEILRPDAADGELTDAVLDAMRRRVREELTEPAERLAELCRSELASARGSADAAVPDLERITEAATRLSRLVRSDAATLGEEREPRSGRVPTHDLAARVIAGLPRAGTAAEDSPPKHGQILVVDDNEDNRDLLSRQLARQGFSVSLATDGEAALAALRAQDFDLVLLDVLMPGLDGIEVLTQMQRDPATAEIPVIMTSAMDEIDGVVRCIEQGAVDYLTKPFDPVLLQARVGATLDLHRLRAQQRRARQELDQEMAWSGRLIQSLVPEPLVDRVREGRGTLVEDHDRVTVLTVCVHGLGTYATRYGATALGEWLAGTMESFEAIVSELPVEVHWEAGATLVASTGTNAAREAQPETIAELALRLREEAAARTADAEPVRIGIGIHRGPAVAGFIDGDRLAYGLWGEAPDIARELAWQCPEGEAQASPAAYAALHGTYAFEARRIIETSFRTQMRVYSLVGRREAPAAGER